MAKSSSGRTQAQRDRLRKRLQLIAMAARFASNRDPKRDEEDRARGARQRRRYEMAAKVEAIKADARKVDAQERAANAARKKREYYYDWLNVPYEQRR